MGRLKGRTKKVNHQVVNEVEVKYCGRCDQWLSLLSFGSDRGKWDGLNSFCKLCNTANAKQYAKDRPEEVKKKVKLSRLNWTEEQKDKRRVSSRESLRRIRLADPTKIYQRYKKCRDRAKEANPLYMLNNSLSYAISSSLRGAKASRHWEDLVGYTISELRLHLEKKFQDGMSWGNYGRSQGDLTKEWELDHYVPISHFKFSSPEDEEFKNCWSLKNLQPKWAIDNRKKGNRFIG